MLPEIILSSCFKLIDEVFHADFFRLLMSNIFPKIAKPNVHRDDNPLGERWVFYNTIFMDRLIAVGVLIHSNKFQYKIQNKDARQHIHHFGQSSTVPCKQLDERVQNKAPADAVCNIERQDHHQNH
jgi:hypothetical protein